MILYVWKCDENDQFSRIAVIDNAHSVIWINRYKTAGQFEIYISATPELLTMFRQNNLFVTKENDQKNAMKVQHVQLTTDPENGDYLIISGKSAACIIGQRIVRSQRNLNDTAQNCVYSILNDECVNPQGSGTLPKLRKMNVLSIQQTTLPTSVNFNMQYYGENLLDVVDDICEIGEFGYKVEFTGTGFVFSLYAGLDRTINQKVNTHVIFSDDYENLGQGSYTYDNTTFHNSAIAMGEGNGTGKLVGGVTVQDAGAGIRLFETKIDGSDVSRTTNSGEMSQQEYLNMLQQLCRIYLAKSKATEDFSADILNSNFYEYGTDYSLGDKVTVINRYGIIGAAIVAEVTEVEDETGYRLIPTLTDWSVN